MNGSYRSNVEGYVIATLAFAFVQQANATQVALVASVDSVAPGQSFLVGVEMSIEPGWHTYWTNPGPAGMATSVEWNTSASIEMSPLEWPVPHEYDSLGSTSLGFEDRVTALTEVQVPDDFDGDRIDFQAAVNWLECASVCVPGSANVTTSIPIGETTLSSEARTLEMLWRQLPINDRFTDPEAARYDPAEHRVVLSNPKRAAMYELFAEDDAYVAMRVEGRHDGDQVVFDLPRNGFVPDLPETVSFVIREMLPLDSTWPPSQTFQFRVDSPEQALPRVVRDVEGSL